MLQVSFRNVLYRLQQSSEHELLPVLDGSFTVGDFTPGIEFGIEIAKGIGSFADITWTWAAATLATRSVQMTGPTVAKFTFVLRLLQASQALLVLDFAALPCRVCLEGRSMIPLLLSWEEDTESEVLIVYSDESKPDSCETICARGVWRCGV